MVKKTITFANIILLTVSVSFSMNFNTNIWGQEKMDVSFLVLAFASSYFIFAESNSDLLIEYRKRVCNNEATCSLLYHQNIPSEMRNLEGRNCLCDSDCKEYKDCCVDSHYYRIREQLPPLPYYCSPDKKVYMKVHCLHSWTDENIVSKCQKSILPLEDDLSVITPLTNMNTGITYGNVYCAICNDAFNKDNMQEFHTWNLTARCGELPYSFMPSPVTPPDNNAAFPIDVNYQVPQIIPLNQNYEIVLKLNYPNSHQIAVNENGYFLLDLFLYYVNENPPIIRVVRSAHLPINILPDSSWLIQNTSSVVNRYRRNVNLDVDFNKFAKEWDAIALHAQYDSFNKMWISKYKNKYFVCEFDSKLPSDDVPLRTCIPNVISECVNFDNSVFVHECQIKTSVVYDRSGYAYRNKDCAICNGVAEEDTVVCP